MTTPALIPKLRKSSVVLMSVFVAVVAVSYLVMMNIGRIDSMLSGYIRWATGAHYEVACYKNFCLSASPDDFFEIRSGYRRSMVVDLKVQFPDGSVVSLAAISLSDAESLFPQKVESIHPDLNEEIVRFEGGFNDLSFLGGRIWGICLNSSSQVKIDFGDGEFVELPANREKLLRVLGPPESWEDRARGVP